MQVTNAVPLSQVAGLVAVEAGYSFSLPPGLDPSIVVSLEAVPARDAMRELGTASGFVAEFVRDDFVRFIKPEDRALGVGVVASGLGSPEYVSEVMEQAVPGVQAITSSGLVAAVGDDEDVSEALLVAQAVQSGRDGWLVDVRLVQTSDDLASSLGLGAGVDGEISGTIAGAFGSTSTPVDFGGVLDASARVVLSATETTSHAELLTTATLFVLEGDTARLQQGDVVPVPRRSINETGVIETTGFDLIETGLIVDLEARRVGDGRLLVSVAPTLSSVTGFIEDAPITSNSTVQSTLILSDGQWAMMSGLKSQESVRDASGLPGTARSWFGSVRGRTSSEGRLLVLLRARRVASGS